MATKGATVSCGGLAMIGRREFGMASLSALALATADTALAQKGPKAPTAGHRHDHDDMSSCAEACSDCQRECESCATHCGHQLQQGKQEHLKTLETCRDCATACAAASQIAARSGPFAAQICQACAETCAGCAEACEKFSDDEHMKKCAAQCRKCEKACRQMIAHVGHGPHE
jgi:hypothetical protein